MARFLIMAMRPLLAPWRGLGIRPRLTPRVMQALGPFSVISAGRAGRPSQF